jgi:cell division protease FtsH
MGGRVAEELVFHQLTTGASNDIQVATDLARKMVCDWGMSEKLGPLHFGKREGEVFLGRDFGDAGKEYSEETAVEIDGEVRKIVTANYDRAKKVVVDNVDKLKLLAEALLEHETIDGAEIDRIFAGEKLVRKLTATSPTTPSPKVAEKPPRPSIFAPPRPVPDKA